MITKKQLQERLENVVQGIEQTKSLFQQLSGQKALIEGLIQEIEQAENTGQPSEGNNG